MTSVLTLVLLAVLLAGWPDPVAAQGGKQVKVRLAPTISWFSVDKSGVIDVNEAFIELVVPSGRPVVLGGATTRTHELTRRILGYRASEIGTETTMVLTATIR